MTERSGRRGSAALPVALLVVAAACLWGASRMTWVRLTSFDGLGESRTDELLGSTWA
ncbi:MAG: Trp biosynthesis-associated membrane protein, partial [Rhodococcus sp. (in: high G+C Gram-positive bacteria)]